MKTRHFIKATDFSYKEAASVFELAHTLKHSRGEEEPVLRGQTWALIFTKSSTRTRVSFEVGIHELGGYPLFLEQKNLQINRGESLQDTAKVLSRYLHGLIIRCHEHEVIETLAKEGSIPVINGLTDFLHPCQLYSDCFTLTERWGRPGALLDSLKGRTVAFLGDCASNMAHSWILTGALFGMNVVLAGPEHYSPEAKIDEVLSQNSLPKNYTFTTDANMAVTDADVVTTDVWVSMGREGESEKRMNKFLPYQVTLDLFNLAKPEALFLHCLPAHIGQEVSSETYHHERSIVYDEAENRLHMQKAILHTLVTSA